MTASREYPASDDRLVWYAGYGSNLLRQRFECYIAGGKPATSTRDYAGCRDRSAIRGDQPLVIPHRLYFADRSESWGGAVGFIRREASDIATYGRMYLITYGQFNDVVRQENGRRVPGEVIVPRFEDLATQESWQIDCFRLYGRLMKTGNRDGHPILTFTATREDFAIGQPSGAYVRTISGGLSETYPSLSKTQILDYLDRAEGIRGLVDRERLAEWI